MIHPPTAIVLGTDSPIGLTIVRELGAHGVPVHAVGRRRSLGSASRWCTGFTQREKAPLADWLPDLIARTGAGALLAVSEPDLVELTAMPARLGGCHILTPRAGPLAVVLDKSETLRRAEALGMAVPQSWQPLAEDDVAARAGAMRYPLIAKWANPPQVGPLLAARGLEMHKAEFLHDAGALAAMIDRYRPIGCWPLVQSYCPGVGLGQMLFMEAGEPTMRFQHRRLREWPPEGGVSTCCAAEPFAPHEAQMARSAALLRTIGWEGPAMVEYRFDAATGDYWLMEINGRFWGSLPLAWHSGAHFAWEAYRRAVLGDHAPAPPPRMDLRARFVVPDTRRLLRVLFALSAISDPMFAAAPLHELADYFGGFADPAMRYYVAAFADPRPLFTDTLTMIRKAITRR